MTVPIEASIAGVEPQLQPKFDLSSIDTAVQAVSGYAKFGNIPMPEEVQMDLALSGVPAAQLSSWLWSLDGDYKKATKRQSEPTGFTFQPTAPEKMLMFAASVTGSARPAVLNEFAVQQMKQKLVDEGYLDLTPQEIASPRWLPEYGAAVRQYQIDLANAEFQGKKPSGFQATEIIGTMGKLYAPSALATAVTKMGLWWDVDKISQEYQGWGEAWDRFKKDPLSLKNLVGILGPIDDVAMPILNWWLLLSGVGDAYLAGKALLTAGKAAKGLEGLAAVGEIATRLGGQEAAQALGQRGIARGLLAGESKVSQLLQRSETVAQLGSKLDELASTPGMLAARKGVQTGMKIGQVAQLEQMAGLGGGQLPGMKPVSDWMEENIETGWLGSVADVVTLPFTPLTIWKPGTFSEPAKAVAAKAANAFYTHFGLNDPATRLAAEAADIVVRAAKQRYADDPAVVAAIERAFQEGGIDKLAAELVGPDPAGAKRRISYMMAGAIIDTTAREYSGMLGTDYKLESAGEVFYKVRQKLHAQLRPLHPYDVEGALDALTAATSAEWDLDFAASTGRNLDETIRQTPKKLFEKRERILRKLYETDEELAARGGQVADGEVRIFFKPDGERMIHSTTPMGEDPFFFDVNVDEFAGMTGMERSEAETFLRTLDDDWVDPDIEHVLDRMKGRYMARYDGELAPTRMPRLSEAARVRRYHPDRVKRIREAVEWHNDLRRQSFSEMSKTALKRKDDLAAYMADNWDYLQNWDGYSESWGLVEEARNMGLLDNVTYKPVTSVNGMTMSIRPYLDAAWEETAARETWDIYNGLLWGDTSFKKTTMAALTSPFARMIDPFRYGFSVARADSVTKQDIAQTVAIAQYPLELLKKARRIFTEGIYGEAGKVSDELAQLAQQMYGVNGIEQLSLRNADKVVQAWIAAAGLGQTKSKTQLMSLIRYARRRQISLADVESVLMQDITALLQSSRWDELKVPRILNVQDPVEALGERIKMAHRRARMVASEVEGVPGEVVDRLAVRGYKLVHGVDFLSPFALDDIIPELKQVRSSQVKAMRMQQFVSRKSVAAQRSLYNRAMRVGMYRALRSGYDQAVESGDKTFRFVLPDSPFSNEGDIDKLWSDLWTIQRDLRSAAQSELEQADKIGGMFTKLGARWRVGSYPRFFPDLVSSAHWARYTRAALRDRGYSESEIAAIVKGLRQSRADSFEQFGLQAIENKLRKKGVLDGLRLFARHQAADNITEYKMGMMRFAGAAVMGTGAYRASVKSSSEQDPLKHLPAAALGAAAGYALGTAAARHYLPVSVRQSSKLSAAVERWSSKAWADYTYLPDQLVHVRDLFRFTLSPIFDASRYTEAAILGQMVDVPGTTAKLHLNQSPKAFRRWVRNELKAKGMDEREATEAAMQEWRKVRDEFAHAAKGDFDYDSVESIGGWFDQVGMLGFSPAQWMASTFGELRRRFGLSPQEAYRISRELHTYGIEGRSAAELSLNFIWFPFSFQKKTLMHMKDFFGSDLGRTVLLHDAVKTYQTLDDQYDLSGWASDHLPILEKMYRLNVLAYGLSFGEFGGINAPILRGLGSIPGGVGSAFKAPGAFAEGILSVLGGKQSIANLFVPQATMLRSPDDVRTFQTNVRRILPVIGDLSSMYDMLIQQGRVAVSKSHLTYRAEQERGWDEWRSFQNDLEQQFRAVGTTWHRVMSGSSPVSQYYRALAQQKRIELARLYPAWVQDFGDGISSNVSLQMELQQRLTDPNPKYGDASLAAFQRTFDLVETELKNAGFTWQEPETIPPQYFDMLRREAIRLGSKDPAFVPLYNRFYRRLLGDIATELTR